MLKTKLCDYNDIYIIVKGKETITGQWADMGVPPLAGRKAVVGFK